MDSISACPIDFRGICGIFGDREKLWNAIKYKGYDFGERDLVQAMAVCMTELEAS
jgi:hypothetical protein